MVVAILKTDTPNDQVKAEKGDYGNIFTTLLRNAGYAGDIEAYDVINGHYPNLDELKSTDALLITGSRHNAWEDVPWINELVQFIQKAYGKLPVVGICFGHQIVGRSLGADVGRTTQWETGSSQIELTDLGRQIIGGLDESPAIMQMHLDEVRELPKGTELLAFNKQTAIQGFYKKHTAFCLQGHPEFDDFVITAIAHNRFEGELQKDTIARAHGKNDGPIIAKSIVKFINGEL